MHQIILEFAIYGNVLGYLIICNLPCDMVLAYIVQSTLPRMANKSIRYHISSYPCTGHGWRRRRRRLLHRSSHLHHYCCCCCYWIQRAPDTGSTHKGPCQTRDNTWKCEENGSVLLYMHVRDALYKLRNQNRVVTKPFSVESSCTTNANLQFFPCFFSKSLYSNKSVSGIPR